MAGVSEGDLVEMKVVKVAKKGVVNLRTLPTFKDPDPKASIRHDMYLYG